MTKLLSLLFIVLASPVFAQHDQGGYLVPDETLLETYPYENILYLPKKGFTYYSNSGCTAYEGKIIPGFPPVRAGDPVPRYTKYDSLVASTESGRVMRPRLVDLSFYFKTWNDCYHIKFDKLENNAVRIIHTPYQEGWISLKDITAANFKLVHWIDFYGSPGITIHPASGKLPLRQSPYADSKVLINVDEEHFEMRVNTEEPIQEGLFCKVTVTHYKVHPCRGGEGEANIIRVYEGWIQIIDENGKPLVAHNPGGC